MPTPHADDSSPEFVEANNRLRWYNVGFVSLTVHDNVENGRAAGSGTLVQIGAHKGILTAAHVAQPLQSNGGKVGLVRFPEKQPQLQRLTFNMDHVRMVHIGEPPFGPTGPDIAFFALPSDIIASLEATNVFFNLSTRVALVEGTQYPAGSFVDCLGGVVDERTKPVAGTAAVSGAPITLFEASFEPGISRPADLKCALDLLEFTPQIDDGYEPPQSYAGTSGAALWRVLFERKEHGGLRVAKEVIYGLAFHESDAVDGSRRIACHGPASIYRHLHDAVLSALK